MPFSYSPLPTTPSALVTSFSAQSTRLSPLVRSRPWPILLGVTFSLLLLVFSLSSSSAPLVIGGGRGGESGEKEVFRTLFDEQGKWRDGAETVYVQGIPGWSFFQNLYTHDSKFIAVTSQPSRIPASSTLVTDNSSFVVLTPSEAESRFGPSSKIAGNNEGGIGVAERVGGGTLFPIESGWGGTTYYFHYLCEVYAGLFYLFTSTSSSYVFPRRIMMGGDQWRGFHGGLNEFFMSSLSPRTRMEDVDRWKDMSASGNIYLFDEIAIFDRWVAHENNEQAKLWNKANGGLYDYIKPPSSRSSWWAPMREHMTTLLSVHDQPAPYRPKVTYVSRQASWHRKLNQSDHETLVNSMKALPNVDFSEIEFEGMTPRQQMKLALETDILMGVHGNGLTHEMWLKPGSAVIEIFDDGAFIREYEMLATALGHSYYPIHVDKVYDWKAEADKGLKLTEGFSSSNIRVHAETVSSLVAKLTSAGGEWKNGRLSPSSSSLSSIFPF